MILMAVSTFCLVSTFFLVLDSLIIESPLSNTAVSNKATNINNAPIVDNTVQYD